MKTKTLMIGLILMAVILAPLAMAAEEDNPRGQRGPRGEGRQFGPRSQGGPQGRFQGPGGPAGPGGMGGDLAGLLLGRLGNRLNLTEEQEEQIKAIVEANKENMKKAHEATREAMQALNEAADGGVEAEIIAAGKAVGDAFTEQALQRANIAKQVKAVLTEEQLAKLEELKEQMKQRLQQRHQGRPGDGQGPRAGRGQGPRGGRGEGQGPRGGRRGPGPEQDDE